VAFEARRRSAHARRKRYTDEAPRPHLREGAARRNGIQAALEVIIHRRFEKKLNTRRHGRGNLRNLSGFGRAGLERCNLPGFAAL
jgi:hypothetical protein